MRKRLVRAVIFIAVATGLAVGVASGAGAAELTHVKTAASIIWD